MTSAHAPDTNAEPCETLDALYPDRLALLLVPLCSPLPHSHGDEPCAARGKKPLPRGWNAAAVERWRSGAGRGAHLDAMARHVVGGGNLGWAVPPGALVLDADTTQAVSCLDYALPNAPLQESRPGRAHFVVRVPADLAINATVKAELAPGIVVDLRSGGRSQIAVQPSRHATGSLYTWKRALPLDLAELPECPAALLERILAPTESAGRSGSGHRIGEGKRNDYLYRVGCGMRGRGLSEPEIRAELHRENGRRCDPPLDAGEVDSITESVLRYAAGEGDPRGPRPEIVLTDRQLDDVVDDAVAALVKANDAPSLFLRGGAVVSIRRDEDGRPFVAEVAEPAIVERLACAALWFKLGRKASRLDAGPSKELASTVLQRLLKHADALPPLRGVTESPLLRADGSILDREGYDAATRLYYAPAKGFALARVPEQPSALDLEAGRALLDEVLGDFPTVTDGDYATALGALLTVPLRELVPGCVPAQLFDAPAPGSGKGLLADALALLATGGLGAKASEPDARSDDEWRKRITALLLEGRAVVVLDNVERPIGSPALAAALTTSVWSDRVLGRSKMLTLPNRAVWIATGNNLRLRGDLPRRCVWCRLDARMARPWTRDGFRHPDLLGWVRVHRGELLAAVFTMARAWIAAGRPEPDARTPRLGSFESWRHVVGGTLRVAGINGFLANLAQLYDLADDDTPAWAAFLATWYRLYGEAPVSAAQLVEAVREGHEIAEALPPELAAMLDKPVSAAKRIGHALLRKADTRFAVDDAGTELRLVRDFDSAANRVGWRVLS